MSKVLELKNVTKVYKVYKNSSDRIKEIFFTSKHHEDFVANDAISFDLFEGETLGIIGVNGAGKSTLLKMIAGIVTQTSGEINRFGKVTALLELGTGFNQEMSGYENISLNGTLIGMSKQEIEQNTQAIIEFSELKEHIYQPLKTYSTGMSMRLAFSIALFSQPQILIVDEALSVGDAHFSAKCTKVLAQRKEQNMSIIYVSHDLNSLKLLCDRVILLNKGKKVMDDTPESVINYYNFLIAKLNDDEDILQHSQEANAFGTHEVEVTSIKMLKEEQESKIFDSGDKVQIAIEIASSIEVENLTVGIHIRDKYGQDIYGTNTFLQQKKFSLSAKSTYICTYNLTLNIGVGNYTLGVALHTDAQHTQTCYHWLDNAISFEMTATKDSSFIGLCRLTPTIALEKKN